MARMVESARRIISADGHGAYGQSLWTRAYGQVIGDAAPELTPIAGCAPPNGFSSAAAAAASVIERTDQALDVGLASSAGATP